MQSSMQARRKPQKTLEMKLILGGEEAEDMTALKTALLSRGR